MIVNEKTTYTEKGDAIHRTHVVSVDALDTWDAHTLIAEITLPILRKFQECKTGYPAELEGNGYPQEAGVQWENIIRQMIEAFELITEDDYGRSGADEARVVIGLNLYAKWFRHLWW